MKLIEIGENKFVNPDHVVTVAYKPGETRTEEMLDKSDYDLPKKVKSKSKSFIKVTLSSGESIERDGNDAEMLFEKVTGKPPRRRPPLEDKGSE